MDGKRLIDTKMKKEQKKSKHQVGIRKEDPLPLLSPKLLPHAFFGGYLVLLIIFAF